MKDKKESVGTKAQIRAMKARQGRIAMVLFLSIILLVVVFSVYFSYTFLTRPSNQTSNPIFQLKAAIVDQASCSPAGGFNEGFVRNVTDTLERIGYVVDYYSGEKINVEFYRSLPTHDYKLVILRVHSSATAMYKGKIIEAPVILFTSETYSEYSHVGEQLSDMLAKTSYLANAGPPYYFAITPEFVTSGMNGRFQDSTIIMTGCDGLNNTQMAVAFKQKGAKVYIGWDKSIFFSHTDTATEHLLQHLLMKKETVDQAVTNTMMEVGPDPAENSTLTYYPCQAGNQVIEKP